MSFSDFAFSVKARVADTLGLFTREAVDVKVQETIQMKLSGLGEPPQIGNSATLALIQEAIRTAERGETYYMFAFFRDMIENDSHIQAQMGKRIMSFMGQDEAIEPFDKENPDDKIAAEVIEDMRNNCDNWREGSLHLANGHIWPIAGAEKIYAPVGGSEQYKFRHRVSYRLKQLHPIPYPLFSYRIAYWNVNYNSQSGPGGGTLPNGILTNSGAQPIQDTVGVTALNPAVNGLNNDNPALIWNPNDWHADLRFYNTYDNGLIDWNMATCYAPDPNRHVLHSANVATASMRVNYGGTLRALMFPWFFKQNGRDWFARDMERYGGPFVVAWANTGNKNIEDLMTKAFKQSSVIKGMILPSQCNKLELKESNYTGMADAYAKFLEYHDTEITKAILGQTLSTTSKGSGMMGGSGVADLHSDVKEEWALFDKRSYCDMQRTQIFEPYLKINGYKGRVRSVRGGVSAQQQSALAKTLQSLYLAGVRLDKTDEQKLTNMYGLKLEIFDPAAEAQAAAKNDKSNSDRKTAGESH